MGKVVHIDQNERSAEQTLRDAMSYRPHAVAVVFLHDDERKGELITSFYSTDWCQLRLIGALELVRARLIADTDGDDG